MCAVCALFLHALASFVLQGSPGNCSLQAHVVVYVVGPPPMQVSRRGRLVDSIGPPGGLRLAGLVLGRVPLCRETCSNGRTAPGERDDHGPFASAQTDRDRSPKVRTAMLHVVRRTTSQTHMRCHVVQRPAVIPVGQRPVGSASPPRCRARGAKGVACFRLSPPYVCGT